MVLPVYQPSSWQRGVQKVAALRLISAILARTLHRLDPVVLSFTGNRQTATTWLTGLPVIWLTTTGARSGKLRQTALVGIPDNSRLVLVASNFGNNHNPGWYYNLRANPEALIRFNRTTIRCLAHEVVAPEYDVLWSIAVQIYPGYASYKDRAKGRHIPLLSVIPMEITEEKSDI